ncbi:MAG: UV DNA damage repair endonuclease UvsE [Jaaginema sp. PMC 1079.18]|nr:UV DNA damage repair endonuclease UvsE [Jaaginema sp. PMC 1080.18]MEC4850165.1 UV DNA damage repair endonuclease UvsE [Jaaginema sp. PMC 1079.18]MEC4865098.1 UV DNA damage repair endonuclease UvsE [Jaaginema sp. PMC 1078.18]
MPSATLSQSTQITPKLGLVCISISKAVRFRTTTRKHLLSLSLPEQEQKLRSLYTENLQRLHLALDFCSDRQIQLYRLSSNLFPFFDIPVGKAVLDEFNTELREFGDRARAMGIRLVLHPDQFVVLNSDKPDVIATSIKVLNAHADVFDRMGLPQSPWALMNIHGGKGDRAERLVNVIRDLPYSVKSRITLENDEKTYNADAIAHICHLAEIPMVFDAHHHLVHEKLPSYNHPRVEEALLLAQTTWKNPEWQLVHISNGREFLHDCRHSDLITQMPESYYNVPWIEVEAKHKEDAIAKIAQDWL